MAKLLAALGLVANAFAWGVSWWPFRELQALGVHPLWATALIYCIALVSLAVVRPRAWQPMLKTPLLWCLLLSAGLTNVGFNWAVTVGDVVRVVLLFYLMPAWVVLLAWPILGERPSAASVGRLLLALLGVVIVLKKPGTDWPVPESLPDWLALMGGFSFALTNVLLRKLHAAPPAAHMLAMFGGGAVMATLAAVLGLQTGMVSALPSLAGPWLLWLCGMAVLILAGNLGLQYGASRLPANVTSIVMLTEIVFASVSAVLLGAAQWDARTLLGGGLVVMAALLSALPSANDKALHS
ncbi:DMT family transporter [Rhodoferax aquaticus]|uniref:DMT family transporter n=1 Tax=Rhodoferax aquaticus TaxID=2527691 RepID=A0A515EV49_9BURK|nr:DMT family transporter [Rhodoferax aquaticus]QDL56423.1 DMT family transporter [Rhodoferax aquaticus]